MFHRLSKVFDLSDPDRNLQERVTAELFSLDFQPRTRHRTCSLSPPTKFSDYHTGIIQDFSVLLHTLLLGRSLVPI